MPKYRVRDGEQIKRNGRLYPEGKVLDLTPEEADAMPWAVEELKPEPKAEPKKAPAKKKTAKKTAKK